MKLREMIGTLRVHQRVLIRSSDGYDICSCKTESKGVIPYMDDNVVEWFIGCPPFESGIDFVVYVERKEECQD